MSLFQKLLVKDDRFYCLLDQSAACVAQAAGILHKLSSQIELPAANALLAEIGQVRRQNKQFSLEVTEAVCKTFVTPLEREDIEAVSRALYKITKNIEKTAERLMICPPGTHTETLTQQVQLLEQATQLIVKMVASLRSQLHAELIRESYERIQAIEGDADKVMNQLLYTLYHSEADARSVVFFKDIYELLEKGIDRCRDTGSALFEIVLKNS